MERLRNFSKTFTWYIVARCAELFSAIVVGSLAVRNIPLNDYSLIVFWSTIGGVGGSLASIGLDKYELSRFKLDGKSHFAKIYSLRVYATILVGLIILAIGFFRGEAGISLCAVFILLCKLFDHFRNALLVKEKGYLMYRYDSIKLFLGSIMRLLVVILYKDIILYFVSYGLEFLILSIIYRKRLTIGIRTLKLNVKKEFLIVRPLLLSTIMLAIYSKIDIYIVDMFISDSLGIYGATLRIIDIYFVISFGIIQLYWANILNRTDSKHYFGFYLISTTLFSVVSVIVLYVLRVPIYSILYGNDFVLDDDIFLFMVLRIPVMIWLSVTGDLLLFLNRHQTIPQRLIISLFVLAGLSCLNFTSLDAINVSKFFYLSMLSGAVLPFFFDKNFKYILKFI